MDAVINPIILYAACGLGALGIMLALPSRRRNLAAIGMTLAGVAAGMALVSLGARAGWDGLPSVNFYVFAGIALVSGVRMITHPRPVYSALYFILTIVASSGLYLLLSAEFMAFALIIIYAGAILITYLFVIMLATQAPQGPENDDLADYDAAAREPGLSAAAGFLVLAAVSSMLFPGVAKFGAAEAGEGVMAGRERAAMERDVLSLSALPKKVERVMRAEGALGEGERIVRVPAERAGEMRLDLRVMELPDATGAVVPTAVAMVLPADESDGETGDAARAVPVALPVALNLTNVEAVGTNLLREHPATIEIAGVILLMAMLGATVLARKKIQLSEAQAEEMEVRRLEVARGVGASAGVRSGTMLASGPGVDGSRTDGGVTRG